MQVIAGVVTFNPDMTRLRQNLEAIHPQVDLVLVVDNGSEDTEFVRRLCDSLEKVSLFTNSENRGMSVALNQVMRRARDLGAQHVLLLDQDSVADAGMVAALCEEIDPAVAVVGAFALDRNLEDEPPDAQADAEDVDNCITAGSLCRVAAWQEIAGYDERLFIDFVDFDFCLRLRMAGWRIRITPHAILSHEVGLGRRHEGDVAYNHSAFRSFHLARDMILYARIHRGAPRDLMVEPRGLAATVRALVHRMRTVARFEQDATAKVSALMRGLLQGLVTPLGERPSGTC